jgi:exopolysaccharide biosynthesis WecB/TagA/CpsF family protein
MLARNQEIDFLREIDTAEIGPLNILRMERDEAIDLIRSSILSRQRMDIAICNAHTILSALDDPDYAEVLRSLTLLNDGLGTELASKIIHGKGFPDNLNGTDLVPAILQEIGDAAADLSSRRGRRAGPGGQGAYRVRYPRSLRWSAFATVTSTRADVPEEICADGETLRSPDLLLVAMGNPRQEIFIARNRATGSEYPVAIGVGALFDFMSGAVVRAPKPIRTLGLEWLFRLLQEPRRLFRRYVIGIPRFLLGF